MRGSTTEIAHESRHQRFWSHRALGVPHSRSSPGCRSGGDQRHLRPCCARLPAPLRHGDGWVPWPARARGRTYRHGARPHPHPRGEGALGTSVGGVGRGCGDRGDREVHAPGAGRAASRGRRETRAAHGARQGRDRLHRGAGCERRGPVAGAPHHFERELHHQLSGAGGQGAARAFRHRRGAHQHGARLHERPAAGRRSPQRLAAQPRCCREHHPDHHRCRARRGQGSAGTERQARRHRLACAGARRVRGRSVRGTRA